MKVKSPMRRRCCNAEVFAGVSIRIVRSKRMSHAFALSSGSWRPKTTAVSERTSLDSSFRIKEGLI